MDAAGKDSTSEHVMSAPQISTAQREELLAAKQILEQEQD